MRRIRAFGRMLAGGVVAGLLSAGGVAQAAPPAAATPSCTDVQVGSARSYACLNRGLAAKVQAAQGTPGPDVLTATSPAPRVGTYNQAGTREYLGNAFGRSVHPQRPPPVTYGHVP